MVPRSKASDYIASCGPYDKKSSQIYTVQRLCHGNTQTILNSSNNTNSVPLRVYPLDDAGA